MLEVCKEHKNKCINLVTVDQAFEAAQRLLQFNKKLAIRKE
jgi:hypothetical protein